MSLKFNKTDQSSTFKGDVDILNTQKSTIAEFNSDSIILAENTNVERNFSIPSVVDFTTSTIFQNTIIEGELKTSADVSTINGGCLVGGVMRTGADDFFIKPNQVSTFSGTKTVQYGSGVLADNGKIYSVAGGKTLEIDLENNTFTEHPNAGGTGYYLGNVLGPNGKIYAIPSQAARVLEYDPITGDSRVLLDVQIDVNVGGQLTYVGGVLANNNAIYGISTVSASNGIVKIDFSTGEPVVSLVSTFFNGGNGQSQGGALGPNGKIYCAPYDSDGNVHVMDVDTETVTTIPGTNIGFSSADVDSCVGAVLAGDGLIYFVPNNTNYLIWCDPYDTSQTTAGSIYKIDLPAEMHGQRKYTGGILAPNGKIYCSPFYAKNILEITPAGSASKFRTIDVSDLVTTSGNQYWNGLNLGKNGDIYCIPMQEPNVLKLSQVSNGVCSSNLYGAVRNIY